MFDERTVVEDHTLTTDRDKKLPLFPNDHVFQKDSIVTIEDERGNRTGGWTVLEVIEDTGGKGPGWRKYKVGLRLPSMQENDGGQMVVIQTKDVWQNELLMNNFTDAPNPADAETISELRRYFEVLGTEGYLHGSIQKDGVTPVHAATEILKRIDRIWETKLTFDELGHEINRLPRTAGTRDAMTRILATKGF